MTPRFDFDAAATSPAQYRALVREDSSPQERVAARRRDLGSLGVDDALLRANLISSQSVGVIMARYILRVEPIA